VPRVFLDQHAHPAGEHFVRPAVLVAQGHQAERRVVAVGVHDAQELLLDEGVALRAPAAGMLACGPSACTITPSISAAVKAASGGHHEWKRM